MLEIIFSDTTSKEILEILYKTYRGDDKVRRIRIQTLRGEFESLKMNSFEFISDCYAQVVMVAKQMQRNREALIDTRVMEKILRSLDSRFDFIVVALEELKDVAAMSVEELVGSLQAHEQKLLQREDDREPEQALQARFAYNEEGEM